jgi:3'(2'), 5'-bisphosphate nucleotidase
MPTPSRYEKELSIAVSAVSEAARLCRAVQGTLGSGVVSKDDRSPVTIADFGSQAIVCHRLAEAFGGDPIIAEESGAALAASGLFERVVQHVGEVVGGATGDDVRRWIDHGGAADYTPRYWTLDPIDGTKGFLRGDQYVVALALVVGGKLTVSAIAAPNLPRGGGVGALFTAVAGQGAFVQPLDRSAPPVRIHVSATADPSRARFAESLESGHTSHSESARAATLLGITQPPVRMDSQAKYGVVARGEAEMYLRLPKAGYVENIWDHAAGVLLVEEAGGRVTDLAGKPLEFTHGRRLERNRGVIVTNGRLHDQVLAALHEVGVK